MGSKRNWRKAEDFEFTKNHSDEKWAWEFLRRNPKYINEWNNLLTVLLNRKAINKEDVENPKFTIRWQLIASQNLGPELIRARLWGLKYGLINPDQDNPENFTFTRNRAVLKTRVKDKAKTEKSRLPIEGDKILSGDIGDGIFFAKTIIEKKRYGWPIKFFYSKNDVIAFFDPKISISQQIEKVEKKLKEFKEDLEKKGKLTVTRTKKREKEWTLYLRLLDARRDKVKIKDIGKFFQKRAKSISRIEERKSSERKTQASQKMGELWL